MSETSDIIRLLTASTKLERDRGVVLFESRLQNLSLEDILDLQRCFTQMSFVSKHGLHSAPFLTHLSVDDVALDAASDVVSSSSSTIDLSVGDSDSELPTSPETGRRLSKRNDRILGLANGAVTLLASGRAQPGFALSMVEPAMSLLTHPEVRVREAMGVLLGAITAREGTIVYEQVGERLRDFISENLKRDQTMSSFGDSESDLGMATEEEKVQHLVEKLSRGGQGKFLNASEVFHDTAGWKNLETSLKALEHVVNGCDNHFSSFIDRPLLNLVTEALYHTNRFVRETGYNLLGALVLSSEGVLDDYGETFATHLKLGLADNWSQVRLSASMATRRFFLNMTPEHRRRFYPKLLPCVCLNRYYVAEGVKLYNQETWKTLINSSGSTGPELVSLHLNCFVNFYVAESRANNHAVREAACACIAELGKKIPKQILEPFVEDLLSALISCFRDDSWPVRDAACLACGNFVKSFPDETEASLEDLFPMFFLNLSDNIPSVRQGAAQALAQVVEVNPNEGLRLCLDKIEEGWRGVLKQNSSTETNSRYEKVPGAFGVIKRVVVDGTKEHTDAAHTDQVMYSCGSLAPKMARGGGCMDHKFTRPAEPWEIGDGCLHLAADLVSGAASATAPRPTAATAAAPRPTAASVDSASTAGSAAAAATAAKLLPPLFPLLIEALAQRDYPQHVVFLETFCHRLPDIARGIGKPVFKRHLESFFPALFYSLDSETALTREAALKCVFDVAAFIGPGIFRGRVENYDPTLLSKLPPLPDTLRRF